MTKSVTSTTPSNLDFTRILLRLLGPDPDYDENFRRYETEADYLAMYLRESREDERDDEEQRPLALALLDEAARCLAMSVGTPAEFETLLTAACDYLVEMARRRCRDE